MFKFTEETANEIVTGINGEATQMETDASSWDAQAKENDAKAEQCLADANAEEASCPHYTTETYTDTDEEGNSVEKERSVPDTEADSAALANAARLRAEVASLKAVASALRALAVALRMTVGMLRNRQQKINQAIVATQTAVSFTVNLLVEGTNMAKQAVEAFNVPEKKFTKEWASSVGTNLLKVVGVDLSDGLNDELYVAIGVATQLGTVAGTIAVRYTVSLINSKIGNGIIGSVAKYGVKTASDIMIETYLGKTGAKVAQNAIASALTLHGINALPTDRSGFKANAVAVKSSDETSNITFEEAKNEAKDKYAKYIATLNNYTAEQKQELINKYNNEIDKIVVLSDEEFSERFAKGDSGVVAVYNGPEDKSYIRAGFECDAGRIIHEVGGHGTGSMCSEEGYFYIDSETGEAIKYEGKYENSEHQLSWGSSSSKGAGMNESATEYFTRKIDGDNRENCRYNSSTNALESVVDTITKYGNVDGEELLFETYTGDDKEKFGQKLNELAGGDMYDLLDDAMLKANLGDVASQKLVEVYAAAFEIRCATRK